MVREYVTQIKMCLKGKSSSELKKLKMLIIRRVGLRNWERMLRKAKIQVAQEEELNG